jgi:hypothetical protein
MNAACLPFAERVILAVCQAGMRYEQRDGFLSDDDVLDIAESWAWDGQGGEDFDWLVDALYAVLFPEEGK